MNWTVQPLSHGCDQIAEKRGKICSGSQFEGTAHHNEKAGWWEQLEPVAAALGCWLMDQEARKGQEADLSYKP